MDQALESSVKWGLQIEVEFMSLGRTKALLPRDDRSVFPVTVVSPILF